jgi:hypothetical protein
MATGSAGSGAIASDRARPSTSCAFNRDSATDEECTNRCSPASRASVPSRRERHPRCSRPSPGCRLAGVESRDPRYVSELLRGRIAHRRAAEAHERAAIVDERAASLMEVQNRPQRASELRRSAVEHRAAAAEERRTAAEYIP